MKKFVFTFILLAVGICFSTERATLTCSFDAVAVGYESSSYTQKLLVTNAGVDGYLYNFRYPTGECYSGCSSDENVFQIIENPDKNAGVIRGHFSYNLSLYWSTTHGNVICYIRRGWVSDVRPAIIPDIYPVRDIEPRPQFNNQVSNKDTTLRQQSNKQGSKIRDEELNTLGRNIVISMIVCGVIALLFSFSD